MYLGRGLYIDLQRLILVGNGKVSISLSVTQSLILRKLSERLNRPVSTEDIIDYVWNSQVQRSELHKQINRIREKIESNPSKPRYLLTVRGFGYLLNNSKFEPKRSRDGSSENVFLLGVVHRKLFIAKMSGIFYSNRVILTLKYGKEN